MKIARLSWPRPEQTGYVKSECTMCTKSLHRLFDNLFKLHIIRVLLYFLKLPNQHRSLVN